jgi:mannosyltransferase
MDTTVRHVRRERWPTATLARTAPLALVLVLAAALALFQSGQLSLWRDEGFSVLLAREPWSEFGRVIVETQANMALYYLLLKGWLVLGDGEAFIRSLSALAAVAAVAATYGFAARLFGRTAGLVAALLLAVNAFLVQYAQEARGYSLAVFLVALACFFFARGADGGTTRDWVLYAVAMGLAFYAHLFAGFVLLAHAVTVAFVPGAALRRAAVAVGGAGLLAAPVVLTAISADAGQIDWIDEPSLRSLYYVVRALAGGTAVALLVYAVLGAVGLVSAARSEARWKAVLLAGTAALPIVVPFVLSFAKPIVVDRFSIVALPAIVTLVAVGILRLGKRPLPAVALAAVIAASTLGLWNYFAHGEKEDFRAASEHVLERAEAGDGIVFYRPTRRVPVEYYVRGRTSEFPDPLYPAAGWGAFDLVSDYRSEQPAMRSLAEAVSRRETVWLFLGPELRTSARRRTLAEIEALLERGHRVQDVRRYEGLELRRYVATQR